MEGIDEGLEQSDNYQPGQFDEEAESVLQQEETIKMPVQEEAQTEIVTKFYDYNAEEEEQEKGLTFYNNRYYQSTGIDIAASDGETFDVVASLSGTVSEVKEDPLLGNVVVLDHGDDITTYYASLEEVQVEAGAKVKQGDQLGMAGKNLFSEESGTHVHFEIRKGETEVNPEEYFNETMTTLVEWDETAEEQSDKEESDEAEESGEDGESNEEQENDEETDAEDSEMESDPEKEDSTDTEATKDLSLSFPV